MNLTPYVDELRHQLAVAAEAGGDQAVALAERLSVSIDAAARLVLLDALAAAAGEITRELAPGSVDLRLRGREPEFVVTPASARFAGTEPVSAGDTIVTPRGVTSSEPDEGGTTRTTLRLPDHLKTRMEEAAAREGVSVNSWLVRAVAAALEPRGAKKSSTPEGGYSFTGWVR